MQSIADGYMGRCEMVWTTAGTNRVCGRCMELKDTVVGYTDQSGVTIPPLHPRCRCAIMYREVGDLKKPAKPRGLAPKDIESRDFDDLQAFVGKLDNLTVRKWYIYHDERIHELIDSSLPIEQKARMAFDLRNKYRTQARELMADQELRRELDRTNPNPIWEEKIADKMQRKNITREEAIADIWATATKSNAKVNEQFNLAVKRMVKRFTYIISWQPDTELFQKTCALIERHFHNIKKTAILQDVDGSLIREYRHEKGNILVGSIFGFDDDVHVDSDFDLDEYFTEEGTWYKKKIFASKGSN